LMRCRMRGRTHSVRPIGRRADLDAAAKRRRPEGVAARDGRAGSWTNA